LKIFICSDIHGNVGALEAVLSKYRECSPCAFLCLGDVVGYGPDSEECLEELSTVPHAIFIMGNHDMAIIDERYEVYMNSEAAQAIRLTREQLSGRFDSFIEEVFKLTFRGKHYCAAHGSPYKPLNFEYVYSIGEATGIFNHISDRVCFIGHTHVPLVIGERRGVVYPRDGDVVRLDNEEKFVINPGSVGQPRDHDPRASFCIYDTKSNCVSFFRVGYNIDAQYDRFIKRGFPVYLAERLFSGV